jgi:hypothetical protein
MRRGDEAGQEGRDAAGREGADQALEAEAEAGVRHRAVPPQVQVPPAGPGSPSHCAGRPSHCAGCPSHCAGCPSHGAGRPSHCAGRPSHCAQTAMHTCPERMSGTGMERRGGVSVCWWLRARVRWWVSMEVGVRACVCGCGWRWRWVSVECARARVGAPVVGGVEARARQLALQEVEPLLALAAQHQRVTDLFYTAPAAPRAGCTRPDTRHLQHTTDRAFYTKFSD